VGGFEKIEISSHFECKLVVAGAELFAASVVVLALDATSSRIERDFVSAVLPVARKLLSRNVDKLSFFIVSYALSASLVSLADFIKSINRSSKTNSSGLKKLAVATVVEHLVGLSSVMSVLVQVELEQLLDKKSIAV